MGVSALYLVLHLVPWVHMVRMAPFGLALCLLPTLSFASEAQGPDSAIGQPRWTLHAGYARSLLILGSGDSRSGSYLGLQVSVPMPSRLLKKGDTSLVIEGYHLFTKGGGLYEFGIDRSFAYGILAMSRWKTGFSANGSTFFELGWGLQAQDTTSHDLGSRLNSTPTLGIGWMGKGGKTNFQLTARFMHISNAGLIPRNLGQNQIQILFGIRF
jgi:hypothetical protein